jgi:predicted RNA-binding protein with RPS1 domain
MEQPVPASIIELLETPIALDLTEGLASLRSGLQMASYSDLVELVLARYRWIQWHAAVSGVSVTDETAAPLLEATLYADEVAAVVRGAAGDTAGCQEAMLALWKTCVAVATTSAVVTPNLTKARHPREREYSSVIGQAVSLSDMEPLAWLRLKRGIRSGVLSLSWELPTEAMVEAADWEALSGALGGSKPAAFLKKHVRAHLEQAVFERFNLEVEQKLLHEAAESYENLLSSAPAKSFPIGAIYVGTDRQRVGLALLDKRGTVKATGPVRPAGEWTQRALRWMTDHRARTVVIPTSAPAAPLLDALRAAMTAEEGRLNEVSPAGIVEARAGDDPVLRRVSPEEASAIVLARRAMRPLDEWCCVKPGKLGLVPMQTEIDADRLREVLQFVRERAVTAAQPMSTVPVNTSGVRGRGVAALNPDISAIHDLRPGLQLNGVVTNVTKFGAFVNVGIKQEGLVHISELSDEFVNDPSEVIQTGQHVSTRVISVDLDRGRIALSMRTEGAPMQRPSGGGGSRPSRGGPRGGSGGGGPGGGGPGGPRSGATGVERNKALANLEDLFRK